MRYLVTTIIALLCSLMTMANAWHPLLRNYAPQDYGGGTQNWQLCGGVNDWLYVANNYGLLEYDGSQWHLYGNANASIIHSLTMGDDGTVYVGGVNELGCFLPTENGRLTYRSFTPYVPASYRQFGEVWNMFLDDDVLYVQTRLYLFVCSRKDDDSWQVEVVNPACLIYASIVQNHCLYLATDKGLYLYSAHRLHTLDGAQELNGKIVSDMVALDEQRILISTDFHGIYVFDGEQVRPFRTEVEPHLRQGQVYSMAVSRDCIAFGTVLSGVWLTDREGHSRGSVDMAQGLQNSTVLSLDFDRDGNLWMGLDQGIAILYLDAPLQYLSFPQMSYGTGYTYLEKKDLTYFGTNQGLYYFRAGEARPHLMAGSSGQVWRLREWQGHLFCCHNRGLYEIQGERLVSVGLPDGAWDVLPLSDRQALVCSYSGYYLYELVAGQFRLKHRVAGFDEPTLNTFLDQQGRLWLLSSMGVECLTLDKEREHVSRHVVLHDATRSMYSVTSDGEQVVISSRDELWVTSASCDTLCPAPWLALQLAGQHRYDFLRKMQDGSWVFMYDGRLAYRPYNAASGSFASHPVEVLNDKEFFVGGFANIYLTDDNQAVVGGVGGYFRLSLPARQSSLASSDVFVRSVYDNRQQLLFGERTLTGTKPSMELPYGTYQLRVVFASKPVNRSGVMYRTRLLPLEREFSDWSTSPERSLLLLRSGTYRLEVEQHMTGTADARTILTIRVARPWYLTWPALLLYLVLLVLLVLAVVHFVHYRMAQSQRRLEAEKEMEIHRQQTRILQLESEQAQYDLRSKSRELNSVLLNQVNRNEVSVALQQDVTRILERLDAEDMQEVRRGLMQMEARLKSGLHQDKDWKNFEENFDFVHDRFITRLEVRYPWMSKQEKKLCVYIYMGLQTKEIGPLLGLTTRGVEMMRYRLRQKMQLEPQLNLKQHFESFLRDENPEL